jgi:peptidoglycan/LPS O-acetylase OafA/YrhL
MNLNTPRVLNGNTSVFLDAVRFIAAFTVFVAHSQAVWYPEKELDLVPSHLSHGAVVVFFVMSGFVIAHTTTNKKRGLKEYIVARLSRLYSIFLPAIIITILCAIAIYTTNPALLKEYYSEKLGIRYIISLFFCNEIWFFSSAPKLNGPIWSLSYEFWYYVIFGCFFYKRKRLLIPILACFIAGPKILLMMFIWLTGWLAYHLPQPKLRPLATWLLIAISLTFSIFLMLFLPSVPSPVNTGKFYWADQFVTDWIIGIFIGIALFILPTTVNKGLTGNTKGVVLLRKLGDLTFPIYVLHFPLLVLAKSVLSNTTSRFMQFCIGFTCVFIACAIFGMFLESKRVYWSKFFGFFIDRFSYTTKTNSILNKN